MITGASSGIGAALAVRYAAPGVRLALTGRDKGRLEAQGTLCRREGAEVEIATVDVQDRAAMTGLIDELDARWCLDLVVANAGVDGTKFTELERTYGIFAVNVDGVFHTVLPALRHMRSRGHGQIAIVSSLAGYLGLAGAPDYAASKAAVRIWGEALRRRHRHEGVHISVICPGFVESRITASNTFHMPLLWSADRAARYVELRLRRGQGLIAFPWPVWFMTRFASILPSTIVDIIDSRLPKKV